MLNLALMGRYPASQLRNPPPDRACPSFDTLRIVRPVVFHAKARDAIRAFPRELRYRRGKALFLLQMGEQPGMPLPRRCRRLRLAFPN